MIAGDRKLFQPLTVMFFVSNLFNLMNNNQIHVVNLNKVCYYVLLVMIFSTNFNHANDKVKSYSYDTCTLSTLRTADLSSINDRVYASLFPNC